MENSNAQATPQIDKKPERKENVAAPVRFKFAKHLPKFIAIVAILLSVAISGNLYLRYRETQEELAEYVDDPNVLSFKEKYDLLSKVSNLALLPANEDPTVATITNAHRLKGQQFFQYAQNNDKVIIFPQAGRAILYRPSINKIIEAAPVNITDLGVSADKESFEIDEEGTTESTESEEVLGETTANAEAEPQETENNTEEVEDAELQFTLAIYNGVGEPGLASGAQASLEKSFGFEGLEVSGLGNAEGEYEDTIIVDISGDNDRAVAELVRLLGGKAGDIPSDEVEPSADVLVILGQDYLEAVSETEE